MDQLDLCENAPSGPISSENKTILIDQIKYKYSLIKKDKDSLTIKLYDPSKKSKFYFVYEASYQKLIKDIKFLAICENIDEAIDSLERIFSKGNIIVLEKDGIYKMELQLIEIQKKCIINLNRYEIEQNKPKNELEKKIIDLEIKFKDLFNKYEELKETKENEIRNIIKEVIFDKDIKLRLFEEIEKLLLSKYNLNKRTNENQIENDIINKVNDDVNIKGEKINDQIMNLQKQLKDNMDYLNTIKLNNDINYIIFQVKIDEKDLNQEIRLFNQVSTYKYFSNFERDDIETIIDGQIVPIKFKIGIGDLNEYTENLQYFKNSCDNSSEISFYLSVEFYYFWKFTTPGIHNVKLIFKKKLLQCNKLFYCCDNIYKIDCSNFNCSQITNCTSMFHGCSSVIEINLGKLDFSLSERFYGMFRDCFNLEKLDVSNLNTENSKSFSKMFLGCYKLKEINVSKFKTNKCKDIRQMFQDCKSIEYIDMLNWDMSNIYNHYGISGLFYNCSSLKNIKMNFNKENYFERAIKKDKNEYIKICFKNDVDINKVKEKSLENEYIFKGLPKYGSFIFRKGVNCYKLLKLLPSSWNYSSE